ncbi:MAG: hypothetical protein WC683_04035 [bacterium]
MGDDETVVVGFAEPGESVEAVTGNAGEFVTVRMTLKELLASIPKRAAELLIKLLGFKGLIFIVATGLLYAGKIDEWGWITVAGMVIGEKAIDSVLTKFKGGVGGK